MIKVTYYCDVCGRESTSKGYISKKKKINEDLYRKFFISIYVDIKSEKGRPLSHNTSESRLCTKCQIEAMQEAIKDLKGEMKNAKI